MRFMPEDSIMVKDKICTAGSRILSGFKAPFSGTVYEKSVGAGLEYTGSAVSAEFGVDSLFEEGDALAPTITALTEDKCDVAFCNDIFGKLRRQAPEKGLIYIHPAYGTVSRYGLIPAVSSMDQIGVLCRNIEEGIKALTIISGHDERDGTSLPKAAYSYHTGNPMEKIGVPAAVDKTIFEGGCQTAEIELKYLDILPQVFYILSAAEISNNTNRYDGVKFGFRADDANGINDLYIKTRSAGFGRDMQLASIAGCMVLSKEHYDSLYHKSMQIRRLVKDYYGKILSEVDCIALPAAVGGDKFKQLALYALAPLCGFASVSFSYKSTPLQLITAGGENKIFSFIREVTE